MSRVSLSRAFLDRFDFGGTRAFFALSNLELHFLSFAEGGITLGDNFGVVDKQILGSVIRRDESKTFLFIKPFYRTRTHL